MNATNGKKHKELLNDIKSNVKEERMKMKRTITLPDFDTVKGLSSAQERKILYYTIQKSACARAA